MNDEGFGLIARYENAPLEEVALSFVDWADRTGLEPPNAPSETVGIERAPTAPELFETIEKSGFDPSEKEELKKIIATQLIPIWEMRYFAPLVAEVGDRLGRWDIVALVFPGASAAFLAEPSILHP